MEDRCRRWGRRVEIRGWGLSGGSTHPLSSSGTSSYGSRPLEGFVGTGSCEFPMTLVSVDRIEDIEDMVPPIPVPPPCWSLEDRLGPEVGWSCILEQRGHPVPEYPAPPLYCSFSPST